MIDFPSRRATIVSAVVFVSILAVAFGPRVRVEESWVEPSLPADPIALDEWIARREAGVSGIRDGDARGVVWNAPERPLRTPVSIVYLHGFSADRHEIEPVLTRVGREIGANVYFARLRGHGRDGPAMAEATVEQWFADAAEALAIGARIGERVVVVGTSTGGTLATWLGTRHEARDRLDALVLISPNFQPRDRSSRILLYPWGGVIARLMVGVERCFTPENAEQARHWTTCYPTSALSTMMALTEHVRTGDLTRIVVPGLVLYSPDDEVVDTGELLKTVGEMTMTDLSVHAVTSSDDSQRHVLAGDILSPGSSDEVREAILAFLREEGLVAP